MEAHQNQRITNKEPRNKTLSAGGKGGAPIAGLLVFGGALAVTGLIAVTSFITNRKKAKAMAKAASPEFQLSESDHSSEGIASLQDSSTNHDNACYETSDTNRDEVLSCESLPSQTFILEDKPDLKVEETYVEEETSESLHQEIVLSDDSPPESTVSFNDNEIGEEALESSADSPCFEAVVQSEAQEPLKSVEINEVQHDNGGATTEIEEAEEEIVEEGDDVGFEKSESSCSEATGTTSLDSSEAAIWPAEMIQEEPQQVKGEMVNKKSEAEETAKSNIYPMSDKSLSGANVSEFSGNDRVMESSKANLYVVLNYHLSVFKFRTSGILLLVLTILLLVLLAHRNRISGSSTAENL